MTAETASMPWSSDIRNRARAAAARTPVLVASTAVALRGTQSLPARSAPHTTTTAPTRRLSATGQKPSADGAFAIAAKPTPKPQPASSPSTTPVGAVAALAGLTGVPDGSRATRKVAGTASTMPNHAIAEGRSPVSTPTAAGTSAARTPDVGATTP